MIKIYRKTATIKAEQFDCSNDMVNRYGLIDRGGHIVDGLHVDDMCFVPTLEGQMKINIHDWVATGVNGEHWSIADDVFKKTYAELPVIPKAVADWIEKCKNDGTSVGDMLCSERRPEKMRDWMALTPGTYEFNQRRYKEHQELVARAWLDGYQVEDHD